MGRAWEHPELESEFGRIDELLEGAAHVALCAHTSPDGDALGSVLGLAAAIRDRWPGKRVSRLLADDDAVPASFSYLPGAASCVPGSSLEDDPDLFVCLDLSRPDRLGAAEPAMRRSRAVAVLDHHPSEGPFGDVSVVRPDAAAACVVVASYLSRWEGGITRDVARCLLCGIVCDTGRFQFQNTDAEALEAAAALVAAGADPAEVSLHVFQSDSVACLRLEGLALGRLELSCGGLVASSRVSLADLEACGATSEDAGGLVDAVRRAAGVEVALMLRELPDGRVRGNLRAKGAADVSRVARALGGGGHRAAAGFTCEGTLDEAHARVTALLADLLGCDGGAA